MPRRQGKEGAGSGERKSGRDGKDRVGEAGIKSRKSSTGKGGVRGSKDSKDEAGRSRGGEEKAPSRGDKEKGSKEGGSRAPRGEAKRAQDRGKGRVPDAHQDEKPRERKARGGAGKGADRAPGGAKSNQDFKSSQVEMPNLPRAPDTGDDGEAEEPRKRLSPYTLNLVKRSVFGQVSLPYARQRRRPLSCSQSGASVEKLVKVVKRAILIIFWWI